MRTFHTHAYVFAPEIDMFIGSVAVAVSAKDHRDAEEKLTEGLSRIQVSMAGGLSDAARYRLLGCIGLYSSPESVPNLGLKTIKSVDI